MESLKCNYCNHTERARFEEIRKTMMKFHMLEFHAKEYFYGSPELRDGAREVDMGSVVDPPGENREDQGHGTSMGGASGGGETSGGQSGVESGRGGVGQADTPECVEDLEEKKGIDKKDEV